MECCLICNKETGTILMDTHIRDRFEMHTQTLNLCDTCEKRYIVEGEGVLVLGFNSEHKLDRHSKLVNYVIIKKSALTKLLPDAVVRNNRLYCNYKVVERIQNLYKEVE